jgi:REP element-mobilizing transposase RayT
VSTKFGCAVHAYVLMTNHVHLLLTPQEAEGASLLMKHLGQRYVRAQMVKHPKHHNCRCEALVS